MPSDDLMIETLTRIAEAVEEIADSVRIKRNRAMMLENASDIDRGKVLALRQAGWTYSKIADEMGCSKSEVGWIVREAKK